MIKAKRTTAAIDRPTSAPTLRREKNKEIQCTNNLGYPLKQWSG